jgi:hypothetical protein
MICQDQDMRSKGALDSFQTAPWQVARSLAVTSSEASLPHAPTAAERVIAAEHQARGEACDALSMMVSSVARMVQAGRSSENRWKAG